MINHVLILKHSVRNYQKILNKCFLDTTCRVFLAWWYVCHYSSNQCSYSVLIVFIQCSYSVHIVFLQCQQVTLLCGWRFETFIDTRMQYWINISSRFPVILKHLLQNNQKILKTCFICVRSIASSSYISEWTYNQIRFIFDE